jgi:hypothetical protein
LHERLSEVPIADKALRVANYQLLRDDLMDRLESGDLDAGTHNRLVKTVAMLNRNAAEEMGDLRTTVDLTTTRSLADFDEVILDEDGNFHAVAGTEHNAVSGG